MALVLKDRVKETTTTIGTGNYTLAGAVTGFEAFSSVGDGNTTYYACTDGTDFEVGIGTYTASGTTLSRSDSNVLQSSNSDNRVDWGAGTKTIFCTQPAEKAVFLDESGDLTLTGANYNIVFDKSDDALEFADNAKAVFGAGDDLQIYHDGTKSIIHDNGTGQLKVQTSRLAVTNSGGGAKLIEATESDNVELYHNGDKKLETASGGISVTGEVAATSLDISGDVDVDGTLEADAMTLDGTAITTTATLSTGISNNNVPKFTSGVADNDFLRVDGTAIEGRSASEVLSDIGAQASLTFGISNTNAVKIDSSSVADDEFARFTASGLESRSASEVRSDIGLGTAAVAATGISNGNVPVFTSGAADNDFLRIDGTSIEGRSASEVLSDIGATTAAAAADEATALAIALG